MVSLAALCLGGGCGERPYCPDISRTASRGGVELYRPDSASIAARYRVPDWFRDGKLGIFVHWGVYSVPAFIDCWYPPPGCTSRATSPMNTM